MALIEREREAVRKAQGDIRLDFEEKHELRQRLKGLDRKLVIARKRDELQAERMAAHAGDARYAECQCLGTGVPPYVWGPTVQSEPWCGCPDGEAAREARQVVAAAEAEERKPERRTALIAGIGLPEWMRAYTFSTLTGIATGKQRQVIDLIRTAGNGEPRSIILFGPNGTAKSWLMGWLLATWVSREMRPGRFWGGVALINEAVRQMHEDIGPEGDAFYSACRVPFLCLDDADKMRLTTDTQREKIYALANARWEGRKSGLVTLITMNCTIDEWTEKVDGWVSSRFVECAGGMDSGWVIEMPKDTENIRLSPLR